MIKIYGNPLSVFVMKTILIANYLKLDYEFIELDPRKGELKTPEYLSMNPVGKMPVMQDEDFNLFESLAIMRYLSDKHGSALYPIALKNRAIVDQWLDFSTVHFGSAALKAAFNKELYKIFGTQPDSKALEIAEAEMERYLPIIENQLAKTKYLGLDEISLADINLLAYCGFFTLLKYDLAAYPNLRAWMEDLRKTDFYTKAMAKIDAVFQRETSKAAA